MHGAGVPILLTNTLPLFILAAPPPPCPHPLLPLPSLSLVAVAGEKMSEMESVRSGEKRRSGEKMDLLMGSFPLAARSYRNRNVADVADVVQFVADLFNCMNSDDNRSSYS